MSVHLDDRIGPSPLMDAELVGACSDEFELVGREVTVDGVRVRLTRYFWSSHRYSYEVMDLQPSIEPIA